MSAPSPVSEAVFVGLVAEILGMDERRVAHDMARSSFQALGGSSLRAVELAARVERELGLTIELGRVLGPGPLQAALAGSTAAPPVPAVAPRSGDLDLIVGQHNMLAAEELGNAAAYHLLFSAEIDAPVQAQLLHGALSRLTARHESLRTVFEASAGWRRRVLSDHEPVVVEQVVRPTGSAVDAIHAQLARDGAGLLSVPGRPPVVWIRTEVADRRRTVITLLAHHALADGWSIGILWRELTALLSGSGPSAPAPSPELIDARYRFLAAGGVVDRLARARAEQLRSAPTVVELPTDLRRPDVWPATGARLLFSLSDRARLGVERLATACGVSRATVLLSAWALVVARRCQVDDLLVGIPVAGRPTADLQDVVGLATRVVPVRCEVNDTLAVRDFVSLTAEAVAAAVAAQDVPFHLLLTALGVTAQLARNPLVQIAFAAHDELVPESLTVELPDPDRVGCVETRDVVIHEGHCGGAAFDAILYLQRWGERPRLALEYGTAALLPAEAADLADSLDTVLTELAVDPGAELATVRGISGGQRARLARWSAGPPHGGGDLWQAIEAQAALTPGALAVRDADGTAMTYAELVEAAVAKSGELAGIGVRAGDCVAVAVPRSLGEVLAVAAILRLGAAYVPLDVESPDAYLQRICRISAPAAAIAADAEMSRVAAVLGDACPVVSAQLTRAAPPVPPAPPDPRRAVYVSFTSGSTGEPKGVRVPGEAVTRLVRDVDYLRLGPGERYLRLAPLAFDASTLELFAPLCSGASIEVFPPGPVSASGVASFLAERQVTVLWLTAGLFRLVADARPDAFGQVRHLLTGGDVVPAAQVASLLRAHPRLRITNGYGPTENTTFTTVHHVDAPPPVDEPLPIGRPVAGTRVHVVDTAGRLLPPGSVGELVTGGLGLALDYAGDPQRTASSFAPVPAGGAERVYHTGDLARWDALGRLHFVGRRDRQVKIAGHRVELADVERRLREHPEVRDVVVVASGTDAATRELVAGVVPGIVAAGERMVDSLRAFAASALPPYAVPARWAVVESLPVTANGKLDVASLQSRAVSEGALTRTPEEPPAAADDDLGDAAFQQIVAEAWVAVLGSDDFGFDDGFFTVGGDSVGLTMVRQALRSRLPGCRISAVDMYRYPTVRALAARLREDCGATASH